MSVWLRLIKFRYHVTFASVICGALLFAPQIDGRLWRQLALLYCCFNLLMYGGIYTLNDVADRVSDARHPRKSRRPVAAGEISAEAATCFGVMLLVSGAGLASLLFERAVVACFGAALVFNAMYSLGGRDLRYVDLLFNSLPHPTRFLMGALLVGGTPPTTHLGALLVLAIAMSCLRRALERDEPGWEARATIGRYSSLELPCLAAACLIALGVFALRFGSAAPGFYFTVGVAGLVIGVGGWINPPVRASLRAVWTR